ncbi:pectinesterase [Cinnamomum micranthum f. kanehirae]|uniref:Pectinesterase n=1 Tax=Cinnamomum micranthum f. kanehirae TaxID=337451 RepID=A0A3S3NP86_9MAGN|nr:pectinesterase [Cinnamomum micranthum f. kanehirae]
MAGIIAGTSNSGRLISTAARNNKKLSLILLSSFLLAAIVIATVSGISGKNTHFSSHAHAHPSWLSAITPDVVVAKDGSGNYNTVSKAVAASPTKRINRYVIKIKAGVYIENVEVTKEKTSLMFIGDGRRNTIITGNRSVIDGSSTFKSATVGTDCGKRVSSPRHHISDRSAFYHCDMLAYQDTLYVHSRRQFYLSCLIAGTVDFIFGNAAAVFQDCDILARRPNPGQKNMITAQGPRPRESENGHIHPKVSDRGHSSFPTYLGRPWREYSRTVFMQSVISDVIDPAGWHEWDGDFALNTLYYGEYQNTGAGAGTANRVKWKGYRVITNATEAQQFTAGSFINGSSWLGSTGFPFDIGL